MAARTSIKTTFRSVMKPIRIVKGLDIPLDGQPDAAMTDGAPVSSVAIMGTDFRRLRPKLLVGPGDRVRMGDPVFADRSDARILHTAPGCGVVRAVNRGARRTLLSVVIDLEGDDEVTFSSWPRTALPDLRRDQVVEALLNAGLWVALRTRPYGRTPDPSAQPDALFVTATDTNPLAPDPQQIIRTGRTEFSDGLTVLSHLTDGRVYVCQPPRADLPTGNDAKCTPVEFAGPHPAGLVGTHIHLLEPVSETRTAWHIGYQDVMAIGALFTTGRLRPDRIVSLAGPAVRRPRLIRTRLGANLTDLVRTELSETDCRIISGSVLSGRRAAGDTAYLGRFHNQISVVGEAAPSRTSGLMRLTGRQSVFSLLVRGRPPTRLYPLATEQTGPSAPLVPFGAYERVTPLDVLPTPLTRALLTDDAEMAQALGCLELDEEDVALWSYVCPSKIDHAGLLDAMLARLEGGG